MGADVRCAAGGRSGSRDLWERITDIHGDLWLQGRCTEGQCGMSGVQALLSDLDIPLIEVGAR